MHLSSGSTCWVKVSKMFVLIYNPIRKVTPDPCQLKILPDLNFCHNVASHCGLSFHFFLINKDENLAYIWLFEFILL